MKLHWHEDMTFISGQDAVHSPYLPSKYIYTLPSLSFVINFHHPYIPSWDSNSRFSVHFTSNFVKIQTFCLWARLNFSKSFILISHTLSIQRTTNYTSEMSAFENSAATPWISLSKAYVLLNGVRMFSIAALCFVDILIWFIMVNSFITHTVSRYLKNALFVPVINLLLVFLLRPHFLPQSLRYHIFSPAHWASTMGYLQVV